MDRSWGNSLNIHLSKPLPECLHSSSNPSILAFKRQVASAGCAKRKQCAGVRRTSQRVRLSPEGPAGFGCLRSVAPIRWGSRIPSRGGEVTFTGALGEHFFALGAFVVKFFPLLGALGRALGSFGSLSSVFLRFFVDFGWISVNFVLLSK